MLKHLLTLAIAAGLIYLLIVLFYAVMQRSLIYYPTTVPIEQAQSMAEAVGGAPWLSKDGDWQGWSIDTGAPPLNSQRSRAIVFHGNAGMALNRGYYPDLLSSFEASGPWEVYVFEYPGYGPRPGKPSEEAFTNAALDAVDELLGQNPDPLLIIGESIGSGVASAVARERPEAVSALLLITPFDSMVNLARHHMPFLPAGLLLKDRYNNLEALSGYDKPLVVVTADNDQIVPARFAQPLIEQHTGPILHKVQSNAGHNSLYFNPEQSPWPEIDEFLKLHPLTEPMPYRADEVL